jgi:hypothetical protein
MADALRNFDRELERAAASLRKLAAEAEDLVALGARGYGNGQNGFASFLATLRAELAEALALFRTCQRHRAEVDAQMAVAGGGLRDLLEQLGQVESIEEEIRLVSLNTAFLCQRIGSKGRVLATIAQELRGRAAELLDQVRGLAVVVEEIGSVAAAFEQSREAHGAARIAAMEQTIAAALDPFSRGGAELAAALARLGPEGSAVGKSLCSSVANWAISRRPPLRCARCTGGSAASPAGIRLAPATRSCAASGCGSFPSATPWPASVPSTPPSAAGTPPRRPPCPPKTPFSTRCSELLAAAALTGGAGADMTGFSIG